MPQAVVIKHLGHPRVPTLSHRGRGHRGSAVEMRYRGGTVGWANGNIQMYTIMMTTVIMCFERSLMSEWVTKESDI